MAIAPIQFCLDNAKSLMGNPSAAEYAAENFFLTNQNEIGTMDLATFDTVYEDLKKEGWKLRNGYWPNMMTMAACKGNDVLVRHLHKLDPSLLNFGDRDGRCPLLVAVTWGKIDVAKTLIGLGADINLAVPFFRKRLDKIPYAATCLWVALEKTKSVFLAKLLLRQGGANHLDLSIEGQQILNTAQGELDEEQIQTAAGIEQSERHFTKDLLRIIYTYV
jgi:hypothetical protein